MNDVIARALMVVTALSTSACALVEPEFEDQPSDGIPELDAQSTPVFAEIEPVIVNETPVVGSSMPGTTVPKPLRPSKPSSCPERMLEVEGRYCSAVLHRCVKGGKTHLGEETQEPLPFYCDKYQQGYAKCLGKEEPKHFCIDEFEYPNQLGTLPLVMVSWYEARQLCEIQGKRLCGDDEWTLACEGPERLPYPYGWERDRTVCNIDHLWMKPNDDLLLSKTASLSAIQAEVERLSKRVPSGSMPECKSPFGVMDMGGNVDEWAVNVTLRGKPYQSAFKGGHWVSGARNRCRTVTTSHDESTVYYAEGFRCCVAVQGTLAQSLP